MRLTSSAFADQQPIPKRHSREGEDLSPPLSWDGVPAGTAELALVMDDPDAPTPEPWVHWLIYKIPGDRTSLPEGLTRQPVLEEIGKARQGVSSFDQGRIGYGGPLPPPGHGVHHYHFKLYALGGQIELEPEADKVALLEAISAAEVLAEAELVGTYERK